MLGPRGWTHEESEAQVQWFAFFLNLYLSVVKKRGGYPVVDPAEQESGRAIGKGNHSG